MWLSAPKAQQAGEPFCDMATDTSSLNAALLPPCAPEANGRIAGNRLSCPKATFSSLLPKQYPAPLSSTFVSFGKGMMAPHNFTDRTRAAATATGQQINHDCHQPS